MLRLLRKKNGQSTLEYAIVIAVIVAAVIAMQIYFRRGVMGGMRDRIDDLGVQFDPGYSGNVTVSRSGSTTDGYDANSEVTTSGYSNDTTTLSGNETIPEYEKTWFPTP